MSLISVFPVDTITPMFFMHINLHALLCLLVLVKKRIKRQNCHIIIMGSIRLSCNNSISATFLRKIKASAELWWESKSEVNHLTKNYTRKQWNNHKIWSWCLGGSTNNKRDVLCSCVRLLSKVAKYEEERKTAVSLFSWAIM